MKPKVYLAGPVMHLDDNGIGWREEVMSMMGKDYIFINPAEHLDVDSDARETSLKFVDEDIELVVSSDVVLAKLPHKTPSRGTMAEMWEASRHEGIPVGVWADEPQKEYSIFVRSIATVIKQNPVDVMDLLEQEVNI